MVGEENTMCWNRQTTIGTIRLGERKDGMKQYILLDLDGTLTNSLEGIGKCFQYALAAFGIDEPDLENIRPYIGPPLMDTFQNAYGFSEEKAAAATAKYRERYNVEGWKENAVYDGIEDALQCLYDAGKTLVVATSKPQDQASKILDHFGLTRYLHDICGADPKTGRNHKDKVIQYALEKNGITDLALVLMVGDTKYDMLGAKQCGVDSIGVLYGFGTREEMEKYPNVGIVETVEDLKNFVYPMVDKNA